MQVQEKNLIHTKILKLFNIFGFIISITIAASFNSNGQKIYTTNKENYVFQ